MGGFFYSRAAAYETNSSIHIKETMPDGTVFDGKPKYY